jgi:AraC-like DNA-binding protein
MAPDPYSQLLGLANLLGAAHGVFLASLIALTRGRDRRSAWFLAGFTLSYAVAIGGTALGALGYFRVLPHLIRIGDPFVLLLGPLLYLYVVAVRGGTFPARRWLHLAPFVLYVAYLIPAFYLLPGEAKIAHVESVMGTHDGGAWLATFLRMSHVGAYVGLILVMLNRHRAEVEQTHSHVAPVSLDWIRRLAYAFLFIWLVAVFFYLMAFAGWIVLLQANFLIAFVMSVVVYAIGYVGMHQPDVTSLVVAGSKVERERERPTSQSNGGDARLTSIFDEILIVMKTDRLWLRAELNIQELSDYLHRPKYLVSSAINELAGMSFNDFVNAYRVREVKHRLRRHDADVLTILAIAMESGFNSKSSFNAAFRRHTGQTPSAFRISRRSADDRHVSI